VNEDAVRNWLKKAEGDLKIGKDELAVADPVTDAVCFHMQQCCEKCLKAFLIFHGAETPRTHNLAALVNCCVKLATDFQKLHASGIDRLTDYAVDIRYGDEFHNPSVEETRQAVRLAEMARAFVLGKLADGGFAP